MLVEIGGAGQALLPLPCPSWWGDTEDSEVESVLHSRSFPNKFKGSPFSINRLLTDQDVWSWQTSPRMEAGCPGLHRIHVLPIPEVLRRSISPASSMGETIKEETIAVKKESQLKQA